MDKTQSISLGGFAFFIEDAAYHILHKYLKDIRISLFNTTDVDEIISDVEFRMAELLRERLKSREVVNTADVDYLISIMGKPEEFYNEEFLDDEHGTQHSKFQQTHFSKSSKKLFRDPDDKKLGGVCSGLGHFLGIDATWVRIITVVLLFVDPIFFSVASTIIIAYFILWLVVPEARTTSDKLQMRGEPVNFDSIKDFFGNSPETVQDNIKNLGENAHRVATRSGSVIGDMFKFLIKLIGIFFLGILLIVAISLLVAFVASILGIGGALFGVGLAGFSLNSYFPYIFESSWEQWITYISLALIMVLPAIGLILLILRLISSRYRVPRVIGFGLPFLWLLGLIGITVVTITTLRHFQQTAVETHTVPIPDGNETIIVQMQEKENRFSSDDLLLIRPGYLAFPKENDIYVKESKTGKAYLELRYSAKGKNLNNAAQNLKPILYNYEVKGNLVNLDEHIFLKEDAGKWRKQEVKLYLYLPEGQQVQFKNLDVQKFQEGFYSWLDVNSDYFYKFDNQKFRCVQCQEEQYTIQDNDSVSESGVLKIKTNSDSLIIKTDKNGTSNISISTANDSISN
ncbi:MAG: PspC domain-containing protein [Flavobacteriaceae bacterium]|nr:PspC domain-containing protein [Flavobacteriaceae bacterium]